MRVEVKLFAGLREKLSQYPRGTGPVELGPGSSLADLLDRLEIEDRAATMILVNGVQAPRGRARRSALALGEGDSVAIFPPLAGGC